MVKGNKNHAQKIYHAKKEVQIIWTSSNVENWNKNNFDKWSHI